jgi:hypothetical protein
MATTAKTQGSDFGLMAIGAIGNTYNAREATRNAETMNQMRLDQVRQNIAFNEAERARQAEALAVDRARFNQSRERQMALSAQEVERQQMMARASGGAFANSMGRFQAPAEAAVGDASSQIAQLYESYLSRPSTTQAVAPAATGPAAEREASMREQATADVRGEGNRLAAVQGFGQYMSDNSRAMTANEQLASLINNFSRGSAAASGVEIGAARASESGPNMFVPGNFIRQRLIEPQSNGLGDMFVGLASTFANMPQQPNQPNYGLDPGAYDLMQPGMQAPGGYGARMPRAGDYGVRLPSDLGIGRN